MKGSIIIKNMAQCSKCKDVIVSTHVHDFRRCSCEHVFVDGGLEYLRRGSEGPLDDIVELSVSLTPLDLLAIGKRIME